VLATGILAAGVGGSEVVVTPQLETNAPDGILSQGDVVTMVLSMAGSGRQGVCALELSLACESDDIRIVSASVNPAFSLIFQWVWNAAQYADH
jgi:hypothetical protein